MDTPLTIWYCDVCGEPITDPARGYVVWTHDHQGRDTGFKIIHQGKCDDSLNPSSCALPDLLGPNGLNYLLAKMSYGPLATSSKPTGPADLDEFVDLVRRLQLPHYEEARRKFSSDAVKDHFSGSNEIRPYMQDALQIIIQQL